MPLGLEKSIRSIGTSSPGYYLNTDNRQIQDLILSAANSCHLNIGKNFKKDFSF